MATLEIPVNPALSSQIMTIPLEGVRYRLRVYYSFRMSIWLMDLFTDRESDILLGIKLVPDWPLIGRFKVDNQPPGDFYAVDTSGQGLPPGRDDFGTNQRVRLRYVEST